MLFGLYEVYIEPEIARMQKFEFNRYYRVAEPYFERLLTATDIYTKYYWATHIICALSGALLENYTAKTFEYWRATLYYMISYSFATSIILNTGIQAFSDIVADAIAKLKKHHAEINAESSGVDDTGF